MEMCRPKLLNETQTRVFYHAQGSSARSYTQKNGSILSHHHICQDTNYLRNDDGKSENGDCFFH